MNDEYDGAWLQYAFGVPKVCGAVTGIYQFITLVPHELSV